MIRVAVSLLSLKHCSGAAVAVPSCPWFYQAASGFGAVVGVGFQAHLHLHVPCSPDVGNPDGCIRNFG